MSLSSILLFESPMTRVETQESQKVVDEIEKIKKSINFDNGKYIGNLNTHMFTTSYSKSTRSIYIRMINVETEDIVEIRISDHNPSLKTDSVSEHYMNFEDFKIRDVERIWEEFKRT